MTELSKLARELALARWRKTPKVKKRCPTCGRDFEGYPQRKYCCDRCKANAWYHKKRDEQKH